MICILQRLAQPECPRVHSLELKDQFIISSNEQPNYAVVEEAYATLKSFLNENEEKIEANKNKVCLPGETAEMKEKV